MNRSVEIRNAVKSYYDVFFGISMIYEKLAKAHGLTSSALFVLQIIYEQSDACTQRQICEKLLSPKQTVNAILNVFEKNGYVERKTARDDRRNKSIRLTEAGREYAATIMEDLFYLEEGTFSSMAPAMMHAMVDGERAFLAQFTRMWESLEQKKFRPGHPGESM